MNSRLGELRHFGQTKQSLPSHKKEHVFLRDSYARRTKVTCVIVNRILEKLRLCAIQDVFRENAKGRRL